MSPMIMNWKQLPGILFHLKLYYQVYKLVPANLMLGGGVPSGWTCIPSRERKGLEALLVVHVTESGISNDLIGYQARMQTLG